MIIENYRQKIQRKKKLNKVEYINTCNVCNPEIEKIQALS
jgi:hypothetical protein